MAYRVTKNSALRAAMGAQNKRGSRPPRRSGDRSFTRNVAITSTALGCLFVISAGVALTGRDHSVGSLPNYVASHKSARSALKLAWVEPEHQAQMERDPTLAMSAPGPDIRTKSSRTQTAGALPPSTPLIAQGRVPLPHAKPHPPSRQLALAIPLPRARVAGPDDHPAPTVTAAATTPEPAAVVAAAAAPAAIAPAESAPAQSAPAKPDTVTAEPLPPLGTPDPAQTAAQTASTAAEPTRQTASADTHEPAQQDAGSTSAAAEPSVKLASAEPPPATPAKLPQDIAAAVKKPVQTVALMSYAPTSAQIFTPDITGSIGNPAHDLATLSSPKAAAEPVRTHHKSERKSLHDKSTAHSKLDAAKPDTDKHDTRKPAPAKAARKLTPQEKLWGPVRVASLTPFDPSGGDSDLPHAPYDKQTAVYVISDKTVYMPDGSELEAHSGLGDKMDDPRFVRVRMRGATPPHVYDLKMRESLFHGVEAIRMLPIGGERAIFGRDGILAHTYMLGPSGQSNGCVSFRNYAAFLRAFKAGKINRLAVISRLD